MPNIPACCSRGILRPAALPWSRWCKAPRKTWCPAWSGRKASASAASPETVRQRRAPIDLGPLLEMGDVAERLFGGPQDMEWTYRDRFHLVQSRDITRPVAGDADMAAMQNDLARAIELPREPSPIRSCSPRTSCRKCCRGARCRYTSWKRCGRAAAVSIWPRASLVSPTASRTARPIW